MRSYQIGIKNAILNKGNWFGNNVCLTTKDSITNVVFYGNIIGIIDHNKKVACVDNCGFNNACTTARINAIKDAAKELKYIIIED